MLKPRHTGFLPPTRRPVFGKMGASGIFSDLECGSPTSETINLGLGDLAGYRPFRNAYQNPT